MRDEVFQEYYKNKSDNVQVLSYAYVDECLTSADLPQKERFEVSCAININFKTNLVELGGPKVTFKLFNLASFEILGVTNECDKTT